MQISRHTEGQYEIAADTDQVITWVPVPKDGRVDQIWFDVSIKVGQVDINDAVMYAISGQVFAVQDPDTLDTVDDMWDRMVPKDKINTAEIDTDTLTPDTSPEQEMGEVELERAFGEQQGITEFFRRRKRISYPQSPFGFVDGSPDLYTPIDYFKTHARIMARVDKPSIAAIGFSAPLMDVTTGTFPSIPLDHEWQMLRWMEVFLFDHWKNIVGLTETGAETPYIDATNFITELLEPAVVEETTGAYLAASHTVFCGATWQITVPGSPGRMSLSGG